MPKILSIDTTGEFGSLALASAGQLIEEVILHSPEGFGHILFDHIDRLLGRHSLNIREIDCLAAANGPGSFTGVRIGLAAAKGLAEACSKPVVPVSNLKAIAWHGAGPLRAAFIDARRGEIYGAVYTAALGVVAEERVMKFPAWLESVAPLGSLEYITNDPALFPAVKAEHAPRALAGAVAAIARSAFLAGQATDPAAVDANYVRRSDAELLWKDR